MCFVHNDDVGGEQDDNLAEIGAREKQVKGYLKVNMVVVVIGKGGVLVLVLVLVVVVVPAAAAGVGVVVVVVHLLCNDKPLCGGARGVIRLPPPPPPSQPLLLLLLPPPPPLNPTL